MISEMRDCMSGEDGRSDSIGRKQSRFFFLCFAGVAEEYVRVVKYPFTFLPNNNEETPPEFLN